MPTSGEELADQFDRCWDMLRGAVRRIPSGHWRADDNPKLTPARWALHAVEAADWYEHDDTDDFTWGQRFCDWEGGSADELPSQDELIAYLDEVAERLGVRLKGSTDEDLAGSHPYHWTGGTNLGRWLYVLRHTMFHTGEIDMCLRLTMGAEEEGEWR